MVGGKKIKSKSTTRQHQHGARGVGLCALHAWSDLHRLRRRPIGVHLVKATVGLHASSSTLNGYYRSAESANTLSELYPSPHSSSIAVEALLQEEPLGVVNRSVS